MPLGSLLPWVYQMGPMAAGLSMGEAPATFDVAGRRFSPSICFESTVPRLIRGQVNYLSAHGQEPDELLNETNDGWFWGSSILDLHFRCAVFRAIENRKPMVIAANTGFSAWIDGNGRILEQGPRRATDTLVAEVRPDGRTSVYRRIGDLPAILCAAFCWVAAMAGVWLGPATRTR
jgi:apolipoprotein N-acyltransferase